MTNHLRKAALCVLVLTGLPALAQAQIPNTCDFDGDGKTDPVIVRNVGGQLNWWILKSAGGVQFTSWGSLGDTSLCGDYDLDGKSDVTVWRPGAAGAAGFWVLRSSNGTALFEPFGQTGDDARVVGDYNGDGRDDFAVYRAGSPSITYFRTSQGGAVTYVPWGKTGDFTSPFDYDGDGKHDPMVQRSGAIWILQSSNGATVVRNFGLSNDALVMGNWDGDLTEDITVGRAVGGSLQYWTVGSTTNIVSFRTWGASATDFITQGDWDGDGKTDVAIWRDSTGQFWLNRSTSGVAVVSWGTSGDYPVNNWRVK